MIELLVCFFPLLVSLLLVCEGRPKKIIELIKHF